MLRIVNCLGLKSCRTKVPQSFRNFVRNFYPEFGSEVFSEVFEDFSYLISWETDPRQFSLPNPQASSKKIPQKSSGEREK